MYLSVVILAKSLSLSATNVRSFTIAVAAINASGSLIGYVLRIRMASLISGEEIPSTVEPATKAAYMAKSLGLGGCQTCSSISETNEITHSCSTKSSIKRMASTGNVSFKHLMTALLSMRYLSSIRHGYFPVDYLSPLHSFASESSSATQPCLTFFVLRVSSLALPYPVRVSALFDRQVLFRAYSYVLLSKWLLNKTTTETKKAAE